MIVLLLCRDKEDNKYCVCVMCVCVCVCDVRVYMCHSNYDDKSIVA